MKKSHFSCGTINKIKKLNEEKYVSCNLHSHFLVQKGYFVRFYNYPHVTVVLCMFRGHIWVNVKTSLLGYAINQVSPGHLIDFIRKVVLVSVTSTIGLKIIFMKPNVFVAF